VRAENRQLKDKIEKMRLDQVRLSEDAAQAHRLQSCCSPSRSSSSLKTVAAQVIGSSGSDLSRSIYIDKGNNGMKPDMAVITAGGIVGKVLRVYPSTSLVLMINDQSSGVGAMLEKSRLQGVVRGTPNGELVLERVMSDEQVAAGETVLSSGGDQIFPKGLPVGYGEQGKSRERNVSEHPGEAGGGPEPAGGSAGSDRKAGTGAGGGKRQQGARGGYSGAAAAFGAGETADGCGSGFGGNASSRATRRGRAAGEKPKPERRGQAFDCDCNCSGN
jgi:hypothetical protein